MQSNVPTLKIWYLTLSQLHTEDCNGCPSMYCHWRFSQVPPQQDVYTRGHRSVCRMPQECILCSGVKWFAKGRWCRAWLNADGQWVAGQPLCNPLYATLPHAVVSLFISTVQLVNQSNIDKLQCMLQVPLTTFMTWYAWCMYAVIIYVYPASLNTSAF